jgi:hypothetical protein
MTFAVATGFSAKVPIFLSLPLSPIIAIALYAAVSSRSWNMIFETSYVGHVSAFPEYGFSAILYDPWGSVYDLKLFMERAVTDNKMRIPKEARGIRKCVSWMITLESVVHCAKRKILYGEVLLRAM